MPLARTHIAVIVEKVVTCSERVLVTVEAAWVMVAVAVVVAVVRLAETAVRVVTWHVISASRIHGIIGKVGLTTSHSERIAAVVCL